MTTIRDIRYSTHRQQAGIQHTSRTHTRLPARFCVCGLLLFRFMRVRIQMRSSVWVTSSRQTPSLRGGPSTNYPSGVASLVPQGQILRPMSRQIPNANPPWTAGLWYHCPRVSPRDLLAFSASREEKEQTTAYFLSCLGPLGIQPSPDRPVSVQRLIPPARAHAVGRGAVAGTKRQRFRFSRGREWCEPLLLAASSHVPSVISRRLKQ